MLQAWPWVTRGMALLARSTTAIVCIVLVASHGRAQFPSSSGSTAKFRPPELPFDVAERSQVRHFRALRESIKEKASAVLERHNEGLAQPEKLRRNAADVLSTINVDHRSSTRIGAENVDLGILGFAGSAPDPLNGFFVAKALVKERRPETAEAIIESLRTPLTRRQLLVRAFVLRQLDHREVVLERIRLALRELGDAVADRPWKENLKQVEALVATPEIPLEDWPSKMKPREIQKPPPSALPHAPVGESILELDPKDIDIANDAQMAEFRKLCEAVEYRAREVLSDRVRGKLDNDELALRAAALCSEIRMKGPVTILWRNFMLRDTSDDKESTGPLDGYPAAQALAANRGTEVADAVIESLRAERRLTFQELLLRAHALRQQDRPEIILVRIERYNHAAVGGYFGEHMNLIRGWFKTPGFFDDQANWPSRMPK